MSGISRSYLNRLTPSPYSLSPMVSPTVLDAVQLAADPWLVPSMTAGIYVTGEGGAVGREGWPWGRPCKDPTRGCREIAGPSAACLLHHAAVWYILAPVPGSLLSFCSSEGIQSSVLRVGHPQGHSGMLVIGQNRCLYLVRLSNHHVISQIV